MTSHRIPALGFVTLHMASNIEAEHLNSLHSQILLGFSRHLQQVLFPLRALVSAPCANHLHVYLVDITLLASLAESVLISNSNSTST